MPNDKISVNGKKFSSDYQPKNNGRKKGSRTRSTIVKMWLETESEVTNPFTGLLESLQQVDIITLKLIQLAREGDVSAYKELMDSGYGKVLASVEEKLNNADMPAPPLNVYNTAPPMMTSEPPEDFDTTQDITKEPPAENV